MTDKKKVIWAVCEAMISEGKDRKEITARKVAAHTDVPWSHTTVSPHVMQWHSERTRDEQEMLAKTQMSTHFVKALKNEVEERVSQLRQIDANQAEAMNAQLSEMVVENELLEAEINKLKSELEVKSSKLVAANTSLEQAISSQEALGVELKEKIDNYEEKLQKVATEHSRAITEANELHAKAVEKLNERIDDKSSEVSELNAKLALAELKASEHNQLTENLEKSNSEVRNLTASNTTLRAEMKATENGVQTLQESLNDTKQQRDKAQQQNEEATKKLALTTEKLELTSQKLGDALLEVARLSPVTEAVK